MTITINYYGRSLDNGTSLHYDAEVTEDVIFEFYRYDIIRKGQTPSDDFVEGAKRAIKALMDDSYFDCIDENPFFMDFLREYYDGRFSESEGYYE